MQKRVVGVWLVLVIFGWLPAQAQTASNLQDGCVSAYDAAVDYFPDKSQFDYAESVQVEYFNHYKVVTVSNPWNGAAVAFQYVLVQCGTPIPDGFANAQVIEVPAGDVIAMSTTYLPHLVELDLLDNLVGVDTGLFINTPEVREMLDAGTLTEIGSGTDVNVELALVAEPDLIMTYGSGFPDFDSYPVFESVGIPYAMNAEFTEGNPLGRAEWIKFTALFYNAEAAANAYFADVAAEYQALQALTADLAEADKPLVLPNVLQAAFDDVWTIPGAATYAGQLLQDAGVRVVLSDDDAALNPAGSYEYSFEAVYESGIAADYWLLNAFGVLSLEGLLAIDARYEDFAPYQNGAVYNNDARTNENGGNDYFESGVIRPQVVLADLIAIFHPDLLPDHVLVYHRVME